MCTLGCRAPSDSYNLVAKIAWGKIFHRNVTISPWFNILQCSKKKIYYETTKISIGFLYRRKICKQKTLYDVLAKLCYSSGFITIECQNCPLIQRTTIKLIRASLYDKRSRLILSCSPRAHFDFGYLSCTALRVSN